MKIGMKAPAISLENENSKKVSLKDFLGKTVVLYFYPKDMTSGCTVQACEFRDLKAKFTKKGAVIIGISKDSVESHAKFKEKHDLNFNLLSDPTTRICETYGVWKEKSLYGRKYMGIERTTFVISASGKVEHIMPKVKVKGHAEEVLRLI